MTTETLEMAYFFNIYFLNIIVSIFIYYLNEGIDPFNLWFLTSKKEKTEKNNLSSFAAWATSRNFLAETWSSVPLFMAYLKQRKDFWCIKSIYKFIYSHVYILYKCNVLILSVTNVY